VEKGQAIASVPILVNSKNIIKRPFHFLVYMIVANSPVNYGLGENRLAAKDRFAVDVWHTGQAPILWRIDL
jgi:hypothetical protein